MLSRLPKVGPEFEVKDNLNLGSWITPSGCQQDKVLTKGNAGEFRTPLQRHVTLRYADHKDRAVEWLAAREPAPAEAGRSPYSAPVSGRRKAEDA